MKKRIFQDLITETRLPVNLWAFFLISILVHIGLAAFFLTVEFPAPDIELHIKKDELGQSRSIQPRQQQENQHAPLDRTSSPAGPAKPVTAQPESGERGTEANHMEPGAGYNPNPPVYSQSLQEPVDLTQPTPAAVYKYPVQSMGMDIAGDQYVKLYNKPFLNANKQPLSPTPVYQPGRTNSSYYQVKKYIEQREIPPSKMVKIEELINAFQYDYPLPEAGLPFSITTEIRPCPWHPQHYLLHLGIQGKIIEADDALRNRDFVIVRDLEINLDFNPKMIAAYRLIGYGERKPLPGNTAENARNKGSNLRMGQANTTLYELIPALSDEKLTDQNPTQKIATIHFTYQQPGQKKTEQTTYDIFLEAEDGAEPSDNFNFSAAVAQFGMLLKNPEFKKITDFKEILQLAMDALGEDKRGYRNEFINLLQRYKNLMENK